MIATPGNIAEIVLPPLVYFDKNIDIVFVNAIDRIRNNDRIPVSEAVVILNDLSLVIFKFVLNKLGRVENTDAYMFAQKIF